MYAGMYATMSTCFLSALHVCFACALHERCMCTARLGYRIVYLQPRTDPRKGPLGANLFLRKDFSSDSEPMPPVG